MFVFPIMIVFDNMFVNIFGKALRSSSKTPGRGTAASRRLRSPLPTIEQVVEHDHVVEHEHAVEHVHTYICIYIYIWLCQVCFVHLKQAVWPTIIIIVELYKIRIAPYNSAYNADMFECQFF